jgi:hypothetical protein
MMMKHLAAWKLSLQGYELTEREGYVLLRLLRVIEADGGIDHADADEAAALVISRVRESAS